MYFIIMLYLILQHTKWANYWLYYRMAKPNMVQEKKGRGMIMAKIGRNKDKFTPDMLTELVAKWKAIKEVSETVHETNCEAAHTISLTMCLPTAGSQEEKSPRWWGRRGN